MWKSFKKFFYSIFFLLTFVFVIFFLQREHFLVKEVNLNLTDAIYKRTDEKNKNFHAYFLKLLEPYKSSYIWDVDLNELSEKIRKDPRVHEVKAYKIWPDRIKVTVTPYQPAAVWLRKKGRILTPISWNGKLLTNLDRGAFLDLPIFRGDIFEKKSQRLLGIRLIKKFKNKDSSSLQVSEISLDPEEGFSVFLSGFRGKIYLGKGFFDQKIKRIEKIVRYLTQKSLEAKNVDVRFSKKAVVRLID